MGEQKVREKMQQQKNMLPDGWKVSQDTHIRLKICFLQTTPIPWSNSTLQVFQPRANHYVVFAHWMLCCPVGWMFTLGPMKQIHGEPLVFSLLV